MEFAILGIAWWVWISSIAVFGVLVAMTAYEKPLSALGFFIVAWAGITYLSGTNPIDFLNTHAADILVGIGIYIVAGILFAYAKWTWFYLPSEYVQGQIRTQFANFKRDSAKNPMLTGKSDNELIEDFAKSDYYPFGLKKDKWKISTWVIWWPLNLFWTLLDDVIIKIINWFANALSGSFAAIAKNRVKQVLKDN